MRSFVPRKKGFRKSAVLVLALSALTVAGLVQGASASTLSQGGRTVANAQPATVTAAGSPVAAKAAAAALAAEKALIPPVLSKDLRVMLLRVYMPPGNDWSKVRVPTISYRNTLTGKVQPIPTCRQFANQTNFAYGGDTLRNILNKASGQLGSRRINAFPYCGPWFLVARTSINFAWVDENAAYWAYPYLAQKNRELLIDGVYPNARYFSLVSYTNEAAFYFYHGIQSELNDYRIDPNPGSKNPFQTKAAPGGRYQVVVKANPRKGERNVIPMYPSGQQPGPGNPFAVSPTCDSLQSPAACPIDYTFSRPTNALQASVWSNPENSYVIAFAVTHPFGLGDVLVVRGKMPITPTGSHPVVWPNNRAYQARYFSICNPVYHTPGTLLSAQSCVQSGQMVTDKNGFYTIVFSTRASRPRNATTANGVNWVLSPPRVGSVIIARFMVTSSNFKQAPANVPKDSDWRSAQKIMGPYWPTTTLLCTTQRFQQEGVKGCFAGQ